MRITPPPEVIQRHRELSDAEVAGASLEDLRVAYRSLRDHHVAETTALVARRDLARRLDVGDAQSQPHGARAPQAVPIDVTDGDATEAHYLPNAPKTPAPKEIARRDPASPISDPTDAATSVAEAFQTMLRAAYQAGRRSTLTGDSFETWYQREVLR